MNYVLVVSSCKAHKMCIVSNVLICMYNYMALCTIHPVGAIFCILAKKLTE